MKISATAVVFPALGPRPVVAQFDGGDVTSDAAALVIDVDPHDDPCHGQQQLSLFNGHYDARCYLPLAVCVTGPDGVKWPLGAVLRPGNAKATQGLGTVLRGLVKRMRTRCPRARLILRADSAFGIAEVLGWCERMDMIPLLGVSRNAVLQEQSIATQIDACLKYRVEGDGRREFGEFRYAAGTWAHDYRIIVKAEITQGELDPRYVISGGGGTPEAAYARYCERGNAENVWKEFKLDLAGGRTSCTTFLANQARLLWHTAALLLCVAIRQAVVGTAWATATGRRCARGCSKSGPISWRPAERSGGTCRRVVRCRRTGAGLRWRCSPKRGWRERDE